jgi:hypothetical protein
MLSNPSRTSATGKRSVHKQVVESHAQVCQRDSQQSLAVKFTFGSRSSLLRRHGSEQGWTSFVLQFLEQLVQPQCGFVPCESISLTRNIRRISNGN